MGTENTHAVLSNLKAGLQSDKPELSRASVFIPLVQGSNGPEILFEVRALHLKRQPGEVCLPGGHIEQGESAHDAAMSPISDVLSGAPLHRPYRGVDVEPPQ